MDLHIYTCLFTSLSCPLLGLSPFFGDFHLKAIPCDVLDHQTPFGAFYNCEANILSPFVYGAQELSAPKHNSSERRQME